MVSVRQGSHELLSPMRSVVGRSVLHLCLILLPFFQRDWEGGDDDWRRGTLEGATHHYRPDEGSPSGDLPALLVLTMPFVWHSWGALIHEALHLPDLDTMLDMMIGPPFELDTPHDIGQDFSCAAHNAPIVCSPAMAPTAVPLYRRMRAVGG